MSDFCAFCGNSLPANIRQIRHRTQDDVRPICCNREHEVERRKRDGLFKMMSEAGKEARSAAVTTSNKVNPRRKRKKIMTKKQTTNKYKVSFEEEGAKSPTVSQYTTKKAATEDARILRKTEKNVKVEKIEK